MNGWTPDMVMRLPTSVHGKLVQMLKSDDKPATETTPTAGDTPQFAGLTLNESVVDR